MKMDEQQIKEIKLEINEEVKAMRKIDVINELANHKYHIDYKNYKPEDKDVLIDKYYADLKKKSKKEVVQELTVFRLALHILSYKQLVSNMTAEGKLDTSKFIFNEEEKTFTLKPEFV